MDGQAETALFLRERTRNDGPLFVALRPLFLYRKEVRVMAKKKPTPKAPKAKTPKAKTPKAKTPKAKTPKAKTASALAAPMHTVTGHDFKSRGRELHTSSSTPTNGLIYGTNLAAKYKVVIQGTHHQWTGTITTGSAQTWKATVTLKKKVSISSRQPGGTDTVTVTVTNSGGQSSSSTGTATVIP